MNDTRTRFVGEAVQPVAGTFDTTRMARGEPGLPARFVWRDDEHEIAEVLEQWKQTGDCTHGSKEQYVRKHWYRVRTTTGMEMKLSFARRPTSRAAAKERWVLNSVTEPAVAD